MRSYIYFSEHAKVDGRKTASKKNGRQTNCLLSNHIIKSNMQNVLLPDRATIVDSQ